MRVAVIGGGAAGMMAACTAAANGAETVLFERNNSCGIKLNITGKGRCNLTNNCGTDELLKNIHCNAKFLYSAFRVFDAQSTMDFFDKAGVPLKTERGNRVFPCSDRAKDITEALLRIMKQQGVKIINRFIEHISAADGHVLGVTDKGSVFYPFDRVILATGGLSYPKTGSDGAGYRLAKELGHSVVRQSPALVPLTLAGDIPSRLEGLSLRNVKVTLKKDGKSLFSDMGEMLFTHSGVSGPLILTASSFTEPEGFPYELFIDLKPALTPDVLDKRILKDFSELLNKNFSNSLSGLFPSGLIPIMVELSGIPETQKVNSVTREQRAELVRLTKALPFTVVGTASYDEAIITAGGISVKEIDPKSMQSRLVKGLHFAGEIIDVSAYTGGFNLQIAWSTGFCAGQAAAKECEG
ncbi:MAG: NAD(P)/FAD-dependent oxidoreductase [Clostridia bacterium]|nr:NAD(P)/FAD-dependent oxidoreductase [Clostridia bacterium]